MKHTIRKANKNDATSITECLLLAMEEIAFFLFNTTKRNEAFTHLKSLVEKEGNQYSYDICWVVENDKKEIVGATNIYNGKDLKKLRVAVITLNKENWNRDLKIEDETQEGEFYIDCIGVHPDHQGKGIGSLILNHLITTYAVNQDGILGLLVDKENPSAKSLYLKMGFKVVEEKTLANKPMEHLQYIP